MDIEKLKAAGIDYTQGVGRFAGKSNLYEKYLLKFLDDTTFADLCAAMERRDYTAAFEHAHTLKGLVGNLSLNRLFERACVLVDALRNGADFAAAEAGMPELQTLYRQAIDAIEQER